MEWVAGLLVAAVVVAVEKLRRRRVERAALASHDLHLVGLAASQDLAQLDRALRGLELTLLVDGVDPEVDTHVRRARATRRSAAHALARAGRADDLAGVTRSIGDSLSAIECGLARHEGRPLPVRRPPCTFNPTHGPSTTEVTWASDGDAERTIAVCARDARRLAAGGVPDARMVQDGHRVVPWFRANRAYAPYVEGWWGEFARDGTFPRDLVATMMAGRWDTGDAAGTGRDWSRRPEDEESFKQQWNTGDWRHTDLYISDAGA